MVHKEDKSEDSKIRQIAFKLEGTPVTASVFFDISAARNDVNISVEGLAHPYVNPTNRYIGDETKDPRILPLVQDFFTALQKELNLEQDPITVGMFTKKPAPIKFDPPRNAGINFVSAGFRLPGDYERSRGYKSQANQLYDRIVTAMEKLLPALESDIQKALQTPLPKYDALGQTQDEVVLARFTDALLVPRGELARELMNKHELDAGKAHAIADTAIKFLQQKGLINTGGGWDRGSSSENN